MKSGKMGISNSRAYVNRNGFNWPMKVKWGKVLYKVTKYVLFCFTSISFSLHSANEKDHNTK